MKLIRLKNIQISYYTEPDIYYKELFRTTLNKLCY